MKRHAMLLAALALMGAQSTWAAVICEPGPDGRMIAVSPWGDAAPTPAQRQRCEAGNPQAAPASPQSGSDAQSAALTQAAAALAKAAQALASRESAPTQAASPTASAEKTWILRPGQTIHAALNAWAKSANWSVIWPPAVPDYPIVGGAQYTASNFPSAAKALLGDLQAQGVPLRARMYSNNIITISKGAK